MKIPTKFFGVLVVMMLALVAINARAEGDVVCKVHVGSASTTTTIADAGQACSWVEGASVAAQCDDAKVCYKPDGGPASVANDLCMDFVNGRGNSDPYIITLTGRQKQIALVLSDKGDGGTTAVCKMAQTFRRTP